MGLLVGHKLQRDPRGSAVAMICCGEGLAAPVEPVAQVVVRALSSSAHYLELHICESLLQRMIQVVEIEHP